VKPKTKAVTAALTGTALGLTGLAVIAMPAGAKDAPELPAISAEELVQSVLTTDRSAMAGTVSVDNQLGLPAIPGLGDLSAGSAKVYSDGAGKNKVSLQSEGAERTILHDGATVWNYNSAERSATKITLPEDSEHGSLDEGTVADPAQATAAVLQYVRESSTVSVDGTATIADRPAYELVFTPKPTERTLLREVRVAVDSATRTPLQLSVLTNGSTDPALQVGFSDIEFAPQPADLFTFTPPQGTTVTEEQPSAGEPEKPATGEEMEFVGEGWDTVVTTRIPAEVLSGDLPGGNGGDADRQGMPTDPMALLAQFGKPVTGAFGNGYVITTKVGTALITDDGRVAAGAVPEQVLIEALGSR